MSEKRFKLRLSKLGNGMITDTQKRRDLYFDKEFLDATLPMATEWLNELADENEQLKSNIKDCAKRYRELFNKYIELQKENKETEYNPPYPKRTPITYESVPEAIYNWDD